MEKTDDFIAKRMIWKAGRYDQPFNWAFFYKDLSPTFQQHLDQHIERSTSGQPVLFFTKPSNEWTLLCTRQVICNDNKSIFKINFSDIKEFRPAAFTSFGQPVDVSDSKKSEWGKLTIVDKNNKTYVLHADKGKDLFAMWNILLMAYRLF